MEGSYFLVKSFVMMVVEVVNTTKKSLAIIFDILQELNNSLINFWNIKFLNGTSFFVVSCFAFRIILSVSSINKFNGREDFKSLISW